jgi:hypothetical protein
VISTDYNGVPHVGDEAPISITPNACKSLQTVTFTDMAGDKHIVGWKADLTYQEAGKLMPESSPMSAMVARM